VRPLLGRRSGKANGDHKKEGPAYCSKKACIRAREERKKGVFVGWTKKSKKGEAVQLYLTGRRNKNFYLRNRA